MIIRGLNSKKRGNVDCYGYTSGCYNGTIDVIDNCK